MNKNNYTYKKLGEVAIFFRGLTYSKGDETMGKSAKGVLRSNNVSLDNHMLNFDEIKYLKEEFEIPTDKQLKKNSLLICMSNGSKQHLGKVAFVDDEYAYAFGGFMGLIVPNPEKIDPKFVYYCCLSDNYKHFLQEIGNGANINNIKWSDLSQFSLPVPPLATQRKIVAELDCLNNIIAKKCLQLQDYDRLAQALFHHTFGDPVDNDMGWEVKKLGEVATLITDGVHSKPNYTENGVPFISVKNITKKTLDFADCKYISYEDHLNYIKRCKPSINDILYTKVGATYGRACVVDSDIDFSIYVSVALIKLKKDILPLFCKYLLNSDFIYNQAKSSIKGIGVPDLHLNMIKQFITILPPLALQQQFAAKVETIEAQKARIRQSVAEVQTLLNYTMDKYFG